MMENRRELVVSTKTLWPRLASQLQQRAGIRYLEADFIRIDPVIDPGGLDDLQLEAPMIFTSGNALRIAAAHYAVVREFSGTVYTLDGPSAAEATQKLPHATIRGLGHNGSELAQFIISEQAAGTVTFFCGNKRRDTLPEALREQGFFVREVLVYETGFAPVQLPDPPAVILFFSPSAVESYLMANQLSAKSVCIAIGATTADLLHRQQYGLRVITAPSPSQEAVVETLLNYLNTIKV